MGLTNLWKNNGTVFHFSTHSSAQGVPTPTAVTRS